LRENITSTFKNTPHKKYYQKANLSKIKEIIFLHPTLFLATRPSMIQAPLLLVAVDVNCQERKNKCTRDDKRETMKMK